MTISFISESVSDDVDPGLYAANPTDAPTQPQSAPSARRSRKTASPDSPATAEPQTADEDYHVHAGRLGGETTKQRHRDSDFYRQIGAMGGATTMARYGDQYEELRRRGGQTTRERYGDEYYHTIAAKAARVKQDATRLRNEAILALLNDGWKIPTIIKLTLADLPRLDKYMSGSLRRYLDERPQTDSEALFVSQSGKPLSLANTYTVMERHKDAST